jgi:mannose-6-phosphate isomerase-like protein (cupin superfamily)
MPDRMQSPAQHHQRRKEVGIEIINPKEVAFTNKKRTVLMSTRKLHSWLIYYEPGRRDEMHCHNGDQTFHMIAGECTMSFPDGGKVVMTPGMSALITGGSFYQLDNTGDGPMVMMGTRSGHKDANQHILYSTRENKRAKKNAEHAAAHGQPVE